MRSFGSEIYPWTLRNVLLPIGDRITHQRIYRRLRLLRNAQWWSLEELDRWRCRRLRQLALIAYQEVPFYRQLFDSAGVRPADIRHIEDLPRLPIVTKAMLRRGFPESVTRDTGLPYHIETSSGSTGEPFLVREDSETAGYRRAAFLHSLEWAGWNIGEPHIQTGSVLDRDWERRCKDIFFRCHYIPAMHLDDASLDRVLDTIDKKRVRHLWGYPCALNSLAVRARASGWNGAPMASVVTWADQLYPHFRGNIEAAFRTSVHDTYGCAEGIQISAQCGHSGNYHVQALDTVVEYVDDAGRPAKAGEAGRVILTRLLPGAMPFLRYDVGDLAVRSLDQSCSCGRRWELMQSIQGRQTDVIATPSGRQFYVHFFSYYMESFPEIREYQVVQTGRAEILVRAVCQSSASSLPARVVDCLRGNGLDDMTVRFESVDSIPVTACGKRRWVIGQQEDSKVVAA